MQRLKQITWTGLLPVLQVRLAGRNPMAFQLLERVTVIGRSEVATISLPDPLLEETHLKIVYDGKGYEVSPAEIGPQFRLNGKLCQRCYLQHGDRISIGSTEIVFLASQDRAAIRAPTPEEVYNELLAFSRRLSGNDQLECVLDALVDSAIAMAGADTGFLILLAGEEPQIHAARTYRRETLGNAEEHLSDSVVAEVLRNRHTLVVEDVRRTPRFSSASSVVFLGLSSVLCVPLHERDHLLGILYVGRHSCGHPVASDTLAAIKALAAQGALLIRCAIVMSELILGEPYGKRKGAARFGKLIGACPAMQEVFLSATRAAANDLPLFIVGEPSTPR